MGILIQASCSSCNFNKSFAFGCGMNHFIPYCAYPAIEISTGEFVVENIKGFDILNEDNLFYNQVEMNSGEAECRVHKWDDQKLKEEFNKCPKCKQYTLSFLNVGCCD